MIEAGQVLVQAVGVLARHGLALVAVTVIWLALSATVILFPPATLGLAIVALSLAQGVVPHPRTVVQAVRRRLAAGYVWAVVNGAAIALYITKPYAGRVSSRVGLALDLAVLIWFALQLYALPILLIQRGCRAPGAWRSALLLALSAPLFTLIMAGVAALILSWTLRLPIPLVAVGPGVLVLLGVLATRNRLADYGLTLVLPELAATPERN